MDVICLNLNQHPYPTTPEEVYKKIIAMTNPPIETFLYDSKIAFTKFLSSQEVKSLKSPYGEMNYYSGFVFFLQSLFTQTTI